jgi:hypothetical protein
MTYPVFASGDVLNAADMNGVGLWLVKTQAVGSGVSSVAVTGAFSADFDNYLVTWTGGSMSVDTTCTFRLGATATGYFGSLIYGSYTNNTVLGLGENNVTVFTYVGGGQPNSTIALQLFAPFLSTATEISARVRYGTVYGTYQGIQTATTSFTGFTLTPAGGTMSGGTIRVYGYRN